MLQEQQREEQEEQAQKCDKKMSIRWLQAAVWQEHHSALRARAEHMNNTNAHTTTHNPFGIAGVRSFTIMWDACG